MHQNVKHLICNGAYSVIDLEVEPLNIAIPTSLISQGKDGLQLTFYVQLSDGFLSKEQLQLAVQACKIMWKITFV